MQKALKWFTIVGGVIWTGLCIQNLVRHFVFGWGATTEVIVYGLVPVLGLLAAMIIWRLNRSGRYIAGMWVSAPSALFAILYLINAEMPGYY
ncbi:MAG: hypothetical protein P4L57_11610 [Rhizomicrobium sp.]|nr:hypothetical protein [Rhizomicrobium sp.]